MEHKNSNYILLDVIILPKLLTLWIDFTFKIYKIFSTNLKILKASWYCLVLHFVYKSKKMLQISPHALPLLLLIIIPVCASATFSLRTAGFGMAKRSMTVSESGIELPPEFVTYFYIDTWPFQLQAREQCHDYQVLGWGGYLLAHLCLHWWRSK